MLNIPDHPEIACALATGYPKPPKEPDPIYCDECSCELSGDTRVYDYDGEKLCENCCRDRVMEDIDMSDIARALGIITKSAEEIMEEYYE